MRAEAGAKILIKLLQVEARVSGERPRAFAAAGGSVEVLWKLTSVGLVAATVAALDIKEPPIAALSDLAR
jgi:hypothetical protein